MVIRLDRNIGRRRFMQTAFAAIAASRFTTPGDVSAQGAEDRPNTHNMLVVGAQTAFLSHLPMFHQLDSAKKSFTSPHRYQVILEAVFNRQGADVTELYFKDRQANPGTRIYTLNPEQFVLTRLFSPRELPQLATFDANVFRGHLEVDGKPVSGLEKTSVKVTRVIHGRVFDPAVKKPAALEYILFGKGSELFLAHAIFAPPDFDHVVAVKVSDGVELTEKDLAQDMRVIVPDRKNVAGERLRKEQRVEATLQIGSESSGQKVQLETGTEFYFEEGELLTPPTFDPTTEEKKK